MTTTQKAQILSRVFSAAWLGEQLGKTHPTIKGRLKEERSGWLLKEAEKIDELYELIRVELSEYAQAELSIKQQVLAIRGKHMGERYAQLRTRSLVAVKKLSEGES